MAPISVNGVYTCHMKPIILDDPNYTLAARIKRIDQHVRLTTFRVGRWYGEDGSFSPRELTAPYVRVRDPERKRVDLPRPLRAVKGFDRPDGRGLYVVGWERDAEGKWAWEDEDGRYPCYVNCLHEPAFVEYRFTDDPAPPTALTDDQLLRFATALNPDGHEAGIAEAVAIMRGTWDRMEADRSARLARRFSR